VARVRWPMLVAFLSLCILSGSAVAQTETVSSSNSPAVRLPSDGWRAAGTRRNQSAPKEAAPASSARPPEAQAAWSSMGGGAAQTNGIVRTAAQDSGDSGSTDSGRTTGPVLPKLVPVPLSTQSAQQGAQQNGESLMPEVTVTPPIEGTIIQGGECTTCGGGCSECNECEACKCRRWHRRLLSRLVHHRDHGPELVIPQEELHGGHFLKHRRHKHGDVWIEGDCPMCNESHKHGGFLSRLRHKRSSDELRFERDESFVVSEREPRSGILSRLFRARSRNDFAEPAPEPKSGSSLWSNVLAERSRPDRADQRSNADSDPSIIRSVSSRVASMFHPDGARTTSVDPPRLGDDVRVDPPRYDPPPRSRPVPRDVVARIPPRNPYWPDYDPPPPPPYQPVRVAPLAVDRRRDPVPPSIGPVRARPIEPAPRPAVQAASYTPPPRPPRDEPPPRPAPATTLARRPNRPPTNWDTSTVSRPLCDQRPICVPVPYCEPIPYCAVPWGMSWY
jgi:hypothetical protein